MMLKTEVNAAWKHVGQSAQNPDKKKKQEETHMKKRILATLLSLCLVVGLLPVTAMASGSQEEIAVTVDGFETGSLGEAILTAANEKEVLRL